MADVTFRLFAGSGWTDSQQLITDEGYSALGAGDALELTFRAVQGDDEILTLSIGSGISGVDTATGHFDVTVSAAQVGDLRAALGVAAQGLARCSVGLVRTRGGLRETMGRGTAVIEPEA